MVGKKLLKSVFIILVIVSISIVSYACALADQGQQMLAQPEPSLEKDAQMKEALAENYSSEEVDEFAEEVAKEIEAGQEVNARVRYAPSADADSQAGDVEIINVKTDYVNKVKLFDGSNKEIKTLEDFNKTIQSSTENIQFMAN